MTKWEYARIRLERSVATTAWTTTMHVRLPDGETEKSTLEKPNSALLERLNQLGAEGWEVFEVETLNGLFNEYTSTETRLRRADWLEKIFWLKRRISH